MKEKLVRLLPLAGTLGALFVLAVIGISILPGDAAPTLTVGSTVPGSTTTTEALAAPVPPTSMPVDTGHPSGVDDASVGVEIVDPWLVSVATALPHVATPALFDAPDGEPVGFSDPVTNPTYFGTELALLVVDKHDDWLQVQLPVRPNGTTAWVHGDDFAVGTHRFHAEVQLSKHRLRVWNDDELLVDTSTVVGTAETPTPLGRFYVNDLVPAQDPAGSYGPWILSLSAHSEVLDTFIDGRPVIAIHGTNRPDLLGTDASNGCIRIPNDLVELLAETVPLGTPVDILS